MRFGMSSPRRCNRLPSRTSNGSFAAAKGRRTRQEAGRFYLARAVRKCRHARFRSLYRLWQRDPHHTLWYATSYILRDQLQRGDGRIEFVNLTRQYLQLGPLVGVA